MIKTARDIVGTDRAIVLNTDGHHLTKNVATGRCTSCWWTISRKSLQSCTWVLIFRLREGAYEADVLIGRPDGIDETIEDEEGVRKVKIAFIQEDAETTDSTWSTFCGIKKDVTNPVRYING